MAASGNNEQQQLFEGFANSCKKIVSPILLQELINDFTACKQRSGTLLLAEDVTSSHGLGNYNHGHNIMRIFNVLPNFPFTRSEMKPDY